jgi:hypothetical protein
MGQRGWKKRRVRCHYVYPPVSAARTRSSITPAASAAPNMLSSPARGNHPRSPGPAPRGDWPASEPLTVTPRSFVPSPMTRARPLDRRVRCARHLCR